MLVVLDIIKQVYSTSVNIRELKQRRRQRQREWQKNKGLDWQNNSSARASPLLIAHFFAVTAQLRCENA